MSDASTSLADHPAGKAKTLRPRRRRNPIEATSKSRRRQDDRWDSKPPSILLDEAESLVEARDWKRATRVLAVAVATTEGDERVEALRRLAVVAADGSHHDISTEAVCELQQLQPMATDADTWVSFALVALARGNFSHADSAARSALEARPGHPGAWAAIAASYAGLGWFDEATACLDQIDRQALSDLERWRIGRAVNRWALTDTRWVVSAFVSTILLGILSVAIATSVPLLTREWRLRELRSKATTKTFDTLAAEAWRFESKIRLYHGLAVVCSALAFAAALTFS